MTLENSSTNAWNAIGCMGYDNTAKATFCGYYKPMAGAISKLRLTTVNGSDTFDAGEVNITME
jgi:hypothetical protein